MKIGLHYELARPTLNTHALFEETMAQVVLADQLGFDYVWSVEHHFLTGFSESTCPEVIHAAISQNTEQIRLGLGVIVLPYHNPVQVAERVATLDHLSNGRVDLGTGRSAPYELTGMGIDPSHSREMWDESINIIPQIWAADWFEFKGKYWDIPSRQILPKPYQEPHPPMWVACLQSSSYDIAAQKGIGVLAMGASDPRVLKPYITKYHDDVKNANPIGGFVNPQWGTQTFAVCAETDREGRDLAGNMLKQFFAPERPYTQGAKDIYDKLLQQWGGVPDDLKQEFIRGSERYGESGDQGSGEEINFIGHAAWDTLDPDTLCERAVVIGGDPDGCVAALKKHEAAGADQILLVVQTDQVPHETVMKSIELLGKYVLPEFKD